MTVRETPMFDVIGYVSSFGKTALKPKILKGLDLFSTIYITYPSTILFTCGERRFCMPQFLSGKEPSQHFLWTIRNTSAIDCL